MTLTKRLAWNCLGALLITWGTATPADAGTFYYAGYWPSSCCGTYSAGYAPSLYSGYYGVGYRGYGWGGASYASYYAPTYYGVSYAGACCSYGCGACGLACNACNPCCDACGLASCYGCGIACAAGCDPGTSAAPASNPPSNSGNQPYSPPGGSSGPPRTFEDDGADDDFTRPRTTPGSSGGGGGVLPESGGGRRDDDVDFRRGGASRPVGEAPDSDAEETEQQIEQRKVPAPADAEPAEDPQDLPPAPEESADVLPLEIDSTIAAGVTPERSRARYTVRFRAPQIARVDIEPRNQWTPVRTDAKLAAAR